MTKRIILDEKERVGEWVSSRTNRHAPWANYEAIGIEKDGELIAGTVFDGYVENARCSMHIATAGPGSITRTYTWMCFDYVFNQLNCEVAIGLVDADNEAALAFDKRLGFQELVRIPNGAGQCDLVVLTMPRKTCRWLNIKRVKK